MKIAVIHKAADREIISAVREKLESLGASVLFADGDGPLDCDAAVALGGDGTIIHAAKRAAESGTSVLGINCGNLGFTAGIEADELHRLSCLIDGDYETDERMMLDITAGGRRFTALNEAVISREVRSCMCELDIGCGGRNVISFRADGAIFATPTGSTAYALSAGGPVVDPGLGCIIMAPVCAHSLVARPYIFRDDSGMTARVVNSPPCEAVITADGEQSAALHPGDTVTVTRSALTAKLIKIKKFSFYDVLNRKLVNR